MMDSKLFRILYTIILILLIIFLLGKIDYLISPLKTIVRMVIIPLLIGGFIYYLIRPMVRFLTRKLRIRIIAIIISFLFILFLLGSVSFFGGSIIQSQISDLLSDFSNNYDVFQENLNNLMSGPYLPEISPQKQISSFMNRMVSGIKNNIFGVFSTVTNVGTIVILIPFVLFYLLKDDKRIHRSILYFFPADSREQIDRYLVNIDHTLSRYIGGQVMVGIILGILTYIGYLIIGLPNALILSLITMVTSFIPFLGPILGALPAIFIAMTIKSILVLKVIIVVIIVQQLEGNLVQPNIQGERLDIHPLMVVFVVIIFIILFGFIGALFAVPTYAVIRELYLDLRGE